MGKYNYMNLNQKMIRIRKKVPKLIRKRYSEDVTYDFVKLDDIYECLTPALNKYGVDFDILSERPTQMDEQGNSVFLKEMGTLWRYEADLELCWTNADRPGDKVRSFLHVIGTNEARKYLWFTSSGLERGTSSGSPAGMFGKIKDGTVYVTEGILKAEIAWMCTGNPYIGVPGVSNHKGLETVLRKLKEQGLKRVYECYDMDKMMELSCKHDEKSACRQCEHGIYLYHGECPKKRRKRDMIRKGCIKLYEICEELNVSCKRVTWDTDASGTWMEHYKGVDDWILRKEEKGHRKTA